MIYYRRALHAFMVHRFMQFFHVIWLFLLPVILVALPASADVMRPMTFPLEYPYSFADDFLDPRGGGMRQHKGNDIIATKMTRALAVVDGTVVYVVSPEASWGYSIGIEDSDGYQYQYLHLNNDTPGTDDGKGGEANAYAPGITRGVRVTKGQHVGWVGDSGNAENTVPHLHFEIHTPSREEINPYPSLVASAAAGTNNAVLGTVQHKDLGDFGRDREFQEAITRELIETTHGDMVTLLQLKLTALGFYTSKYITGYFDSITKDAVMRLQQAHALPITGRVDVHTRAILNKGTGFEEELPAQKPAESQDLKEGSTGEAVTQLQAKLKALGYFTSSLITDFFGPITKAAVIRFQTAYGIVPIGIVGPETRAAMDKATASGSYVVASNLKKGSRGQAVAELQIQLKNLGYYSSSYVTAEFDDITRDAVIRFQRAKGIETTGIVGPLTRAALNPSLAPVAVVPSAATPAASSFRFTEDLSEGLRGEAVGELQLKLKAAGYFSGPITEYFGPLTKIAVVGFQRAHTIDPIGVVGPKTRLVLNGM